MKLNHSSMGKQSTNEILCESSSNRVFSKKIKIALGVLGGYLMLESTRLFFLGTSFVTFFYIPIVGIVCIYLTTCEFRIYLSCDGIVQHNRTMLSKTRKVLPWNDLAHVTFRKKHNITIAYFSPSETMGLKVIFTERQMKIARRIIMRYMDTKNIIGNL